MLVPVRFSACRQAAEPTQVEISWRTDRHIASWRRTPPPRPRGQGSGGAGTATAPEGALRPRHGPQRGPRRLGMEPHEATAP